MMNRALAVTPGGVHSPVRSCRSVQTFPRFMERSEGASIWDVDGQAYTDYCMSWGPLVFGHKDPFVLSAVEEALARGWTFGTAEPYSLQLAEWVCQHVGPVEKVRFVNSGTEAVMSAIRCARGFTQKDKIIKFDGCYHGHVDSMLVRAGSGLAEWSQPDSAGITVAEAQDTLVCPLGDLGHVEELLKAHPVAAIIIEPVPANFGLLIQDDSFLVQLKALSEKYGSLLIFDEVISGFRVALGGMAELCRVQPDLLCYGKVIGGGFPVGAFGGRKDVMDMIAPAGPVYQAGTLSANPVAMAAGLAMVQQLKDTDPYASLEEKGRKLKDALDGEEVDQFVLKVAQKGSLFWMYVADSEVDPKAKSSVVNRPDLIPAKHKQKFPFLFQHLLQQGIYIAPSPFEIGFLSTVHTDAMLDQFCTAVKDGFRIGCRSEHVH